MARIKGVDIPDNKRIEIALQPIKIVDRKEIGTADEKDK